MEGGRWRKVIVGVVEVRRCEEVCRALDIGELGRDYEDDNSIK